MKPPTGDFDEEVRSLDEALDIIGTELADPLLEEILSVSEEAGTSEGQPTPRKKPSKSRRRKRLMVGREKRKITVRVAALLLVLSVAGTAFALTQTTLTTELIEIFNTQYGTTDFSITDFATKPQGNNKLTIDVTVQNTGGAVHYANVTVNLINATGDEFLNLTLATGSVAASGSIMLSFIFNQANVVPEYQDSQIIIDQSS
ncbi:MAG: hypothetical protein V3U52_08300 [Thermoplasmata archaeon]